MNIIVYAVNSIVSGRVQEKLSVQFFSVAFFEFIYFEKEIFFCQKKKNKNLSSGKANSFFYKFYIIRGKKKV